MAFSSQTFSVDISHMRMVAVIKGGHTCFKHCRRTPKTIEYGKYPIRMVVFWEGTLGLPEGGESVPVGFFSEALFSASLQHGNAEK